MLGAWVLASILLLAAWVAGSEPSSIDASSLIPSPPEISQECYSLLTDLDGDQLFQECTDPLIQATSIYLDAANHASESSVSDSLDALCGHKQGCDSTTVRSYIAQFWDHCTDELEDQNERVMQLYDYLYIFNPFRDAMCAKNNEGEYCLEGLAPFMKPSADIQALQMNTMPETDDVYSDAYWAHVLQTIPSTNSSGSSDDSDDSQSPELTSDQVFMFLSKDSDKDTLCSDCTKEVLSSYVGFEMATPYAIGTERSTVLKPQQEIYDAARKKCGANFVHDIHKKAGVQQFSSDATRPRPAWALLLAAAAAALALL